MTAFDLLRQGCNGDVAFRFRRTGGQSLQAFHVQDVEHASPCAAVVL